MRLGIVVIVAFSKKAKQVISALFFGWSMNRIQRYCLFSWQKEVVFDTKQNHKFKTNVE